jgi:soluble lytic murein transglycosylase
MFACLVLALMSTPLSALTTTQKQFLEAMKLAKSGTTPSVRGELARYLLVPYIEAELIQAQKEKVNEALSARFFARPELPIVETVRERFLLALAKAKGWQRFARYFRADTASLAVRCHAFDAGLYQGDGQSQVLKLWAEAKRAEPACAGAFAWLEKSGALTPALILQRLEQAFESGALDLAAWLIAKLPQTERLIPSLRLKLRRAPAATLKESAAWKGNKLKSSLLSESIIRMSARDPRSAEYWRVTVSKHTRFDEASQHAMFAAIATRAAIDSLPEAKAWIARVPLRFQQQAFSEWAVRYQLSIGAREEALALLSNMPEPARSMTRWRYLEARLLELAGRNEEAQERFRGLAGERNFHGFLAADRAQLPYALCEEQPKIDLSRKQLLEQSGGWQRALELKLLGMEPQAQVELKALTDANDAVRRHTLAQLLIEHGWVRLATALLATPTDQRVYALRFPLPYADIIAAAASKQTLDAAWVSGLIRAESAFDPFARSHANARGLMQMLPSTAATLLPKGAKGPKAVNLYDPHTNVDLGTRYMRKRLDNFGGDMIAATAAYNAGAGAVRRWLPKRSYQWRDLWVESIPYFETREYVAQVLAFSVIYDWRDGTAMQRLSGRLGLMEPMAVTTHCP